MTIVPHFALDINRLLVHRKIVFQTREEEEEKRFLTSSGRKEKAPVLFIFCARVKHAVKTKPRMHSVTLMNEDDLKEMSDVQNFLKSGETRKYTKVALNGT